MYAQCTSDLFPSPEDKHPARFAGSHRELQPQRARIIRQTLRFLQMAPQRNKRRKRDTPDSRLTSQPYQAQDFSKLRQYCLSKNEKYTDEMFPPERRSIGSGLLSYTTMDQVVWKRPAELVEDPCLVVEDESRFDYSQGELGNCWFLAAIGAITFQKDIMDKVIPGDQSFKNDYAGIFHFRFCRNGIWLDVVIDDQLPTINGHLIFVQCKTRNEFWPALLEKAYAKLCGSYAALNGGYIPDALRDFTGGAYRVYNLKNSPDNLWDLMDRAVKHQALMGCGTPQGATSANTVRSNGIVDGHAYTVTGVTKVNATNKLVKLVRLLNPWGKDEWKGDWSDKSLRWNEISQQDRKKYLEDKNNGEFWMSMVDFCRCYVELDICCITPEFLI